jgi:DNA polymerase I-like protein with 3'-5' exonuclease and polymerase domains
MNIAAVDFETYYDKDISAKPMGMWDYAHHPKTAPYMLTVATNTDIQFVGHPKDFDWNLISGPDWEWVSHNASFDSTVHLANKMPGGPAKWHCSANMSVYLGGPRDLKGAAKWFLGKEMSKDIRDKMKGKVYADMDEEDQQALDNYALDDALICLELWEKFSSQWPEGERMLSAHTMLIHTRGVPVNKSKLEAMKTQLDALRWEARNEIPWVEEGGKPLSHANLADECRKVGIPCPKSVAADSDECANWELIYGDQYPWVSHMRTFRRSNAMLAKVEAMVNRVRQDGTIPVALKYFGGHTGRWSGDSGINWQNLPREGIMGADLRNAIEAPPGYVYVNADLSQIEPRVTAWLTQDYAALALMAAPDSDLYEVHARLTMGYTDPRPLKNVDALVRRLAKARVLGLTYGCGADKFKIVAMAMAGLDLTPEECHRTVEDYRRTNPKITKYWKTLENHLLSSARSNETCEYELPSGRIMRYLSPASADRRMSALIRRGSALMRVSLWGGSLMENIVQATARDVFAEGMLNIELSGIPVLLHTHDEVLCLAKEDEAEEVSRTVVECLTSTPSWMPNLPLAAEARIIDNYSK